MPSGRVDTLRTALVAVAAGIGDVVRATPLIRVVYRLGYVVDVLCMADYPETAGLLCGAPEIRDVYRDVERLPSTPYDLECVTKWGSGYLGDLKAARRLVVNQRAWRKYGDSYCFEVMAGELDYVGPMPTPFVMMTSHRQFPIPPGTVAFHAGCKPGWPWKRWHGFVELATLLPYVAVIGTAEDVNPNEHWPEHVVNYIGKLSLRDTAALISQSAALVCNDSGMMHIGSAVGTPTYPIFGITTPERECIPGLPHVHPITNRAECSPSCTRQYGQQTCPGNLACLSNLTPQMVTEILLDDVVYTSSALVMPRS